MLEGNAVQQCPHPKNLKRQLELLVSPINPLQCYPQMLWPLGSSLQLDSTQLGTRGVITKPGIASLVLQGQLWSPWGRFSKAPGVGSCWDLSDGDPAPQPAVGPPLPVACPPQWVAPFCASEALKQRKVLMGFLRGLCLGRAGTFWGGLGSVCVWFGHEAGGADTVV